LLKKELENQYCSIDDYKSAITGIKSSEDLFDFGNAVIASLREAGSYGNARSYQNTLKRLEKHFGKTKLPLCNISYPFLHKLEIDFKKQGMAVNTISFYFRSIRALYNRAIKARIISREMYPFDQFQIKQEVTRKRAMSEEELQQLVALNLVPGTRLWHSRNLFMLSFYLIGTSFVDLAFLKDTDIRRNRIQYRRQKTHKLYDIALTAQAADLLKFYRSERIDKKYILPIISETHYQNSELELTSTRTGCRKCNDDLNEIAQRCGLNMKLTTYVARHTWATLAKKMG